jgi:hypothetical protein
MKENNHLQSLNDLTEMKAYLKSEIDSYPVETYKDMDREIKLYLHKLYSFLYFCNECDNISHAKRCITNMANTTTFKDRNVILNLMR